MRFPSITDVCSNDTSHMFQTHGPATAKICLTAKFLSTDHYTTHVKVSDECIWQLTSHTNSHSPNSQAVHCLLHKGSHLEVDTTFNRQPVLLPQNWCDVFIPT